MKILRQAFQKEAANSKILRASSSELIQICYKEYFGFKTKNQGQDLIKKV